ncbi:hypothetical protein LC048_11070 [Mesobacillus subterraneus]|uniref:hypothetical protein n=1 Tax=Mesobacillus subterraneus TaxID=285983 RepID=UPI001CFC595D|nr:hypothetical protein [Mesobacillus subterraneus]WLR57344.1 hypothetical protein LC048_11070 [Mesobacillus subterraneus]
MSKIYGIPNLVAYLDTAGYPLTVEQIQQLIAEKELPHLRPTKNLFVFNSDHINWWIQTRRSDHR